MAGIVCRFKEHMNLTFKAKEYEKTYKRYTVWRSSISNQMCFLPCLWAREEYVLKVERFMIHALDVKLQDRTRATAFRLKRFRTWPRFREKWNVANELQLNQIVIFKWSNVSNIIKYSKNMTVVLCDTLGILITEFKCSI